MKIITKFDLGDHVYETGCELEGVIEGYCHYDNEAHYLINPKPHYNYLGALWVEEQNIRKLKK